MEFLRKSKIILLFSIIIVVFSFIRTKLSTNSLYNENDDKITGTIIQKKLYNNRITLIVKGKEKVLVNCYDCSNNMTIGDYIEAKGKFKIPNKNTVFYLFNYKNYLKSNKIYWTFNINVYKITKNNNIFYNLKNKIINKVNSYYNPYLNTFILGVNSLDSDIYSIYQNNGISHLFAVSGMHISLMTLILSFILKKILKKEAIVYILITIFLLFYMFLTNYSPSVIRSSLLFIGLSFNKIFKFDLKAIDILLIILSLLLIYNPYYFYNISFLFSFIISLYLICFSSLISKFKNYFIKIFIVSLISFLVSFPIIINNFFSINIISPIINMVCVPIISLIIFPLSLLTFIFPFLNNILLFTIDKFETISIIFSKISINLSFGHMNILLVIIYYLIITTIFINFKKYKLGLLILFLLFCYNMNYFNINPKITFIDVGQGDSTLIELPFNQGNILIDTGGNKDYDLSNNTLIPYLKASGIKKLDYLIITHGDYDHMGSSINLIDDFRIDKVIFNSYETNDLENSLISKLKLKNIPYTNYSRNILNINGYKLYFLNKKHYEENEDSLIIYTKLNNKNILLMGDASKVNESELLNEYNLPKMDILKVGHHGSKTSTSLEFVENISPKYSIISAAKHNLYNHPNKIVLDNLVGSNIYETSNYGSIKFILNNKIKIYTCL